MGRSAADTVAADFATGIMAGFGKVADERLAEKVEALSERIIAHLPEVVYLPPPPAEVPEERLLSVKEVARLLGVRPARCSCGWIAASWSMCWSAVLRIARCPIAGLWSTSTVFRAIRARSVRKRRSMVMREFWKPMLVGGAFVAAAALCTGTVNPWEDGVNAVLVEEVYTVRPRDTV